MNFLKIWWHVRRHKGHRLASFETAIGLPQYYCETCRYGLNDPQ